LAPCLATNSGVLLNSSLFATLNGITLLLKNKATCWHWFWKQFVDIPYAAHCIDLMLEDFEKKIPVHHDTIANSKKITTYIYSRMSTISLLYKFTKGTDLIKPANTRFLTSYLTLGYLNKNKGLLIWMFTSKEWQSSQLVKTRDGGFVENLILDKEFRKNILICMRVALSLIKVLHMVDSNEKPTMGFSYEEMDIAKRRYKVFSMELVRGNNN